MKQGSLVNVTKIEDLPAVKSEIEISLNTREAGRFQRSINNYRVDQLQNAACCYLQIRD